MTTILITGANKGLGYETARQLLAAGHRVWMAARNEERGRAAAVELHGDFVALDVTDDESTARAAELIAADGGLDVLVNNAGIAGPRKPVPEVTAEDVRATYETNVFGLVRVTHAFIPLLQRSNDGVIVNVSSGLGSIRRATDPAHMESGFTSIAYPSSKSAVNMITAQYAKALDPIRVNAVDPGYTATDLNAHNGTQTVEEGSEIIVRMAMIDRSGPTGTYVNRHGAVAW
jgi:NAD(P)-dependent dehydrogenase (short-subunit alcohol dehydrogenase family)